MKYYIKQTILTIAVLIAGSYFLVAQENSNRQREIGLTFGFSKIRSFESRYAANVKSFNAPTFGFYSRIYTENLRQDFVLNYTLKSKVEPGRILDYRMHRPDFYYSLQRKTSFGWFGGHINFSTLLTFPAIRSGHFNNAPISYTMAASLGPSVSVDRNIGGEGSNWSITSDVHASLINYVIRPGYAHPYPEDFLESGVFAPTREGMASRLLTSGTIRTIDKYQSIKVRLGIYYLIGSKIKMGIVSTMDYVNYNDQKPMSFLNNTVSVSASYIY